ncbi:MAG: P-loop NTPase [Candidatus Methanospirare jalkutatii]|nr:P-loop NTPase [Candidatus Methanospirare jalkutatii]
MKSIAIYGKGGIGKSSIASNIAVYLGKKGLKVAIIGCDPKSDSSLSLMHGTRIPTILDLLRQHKRISEEDVVFEGVFGVKCVEVGGPEPGVGCAGRGIIVAIEYLRRISDILDASDIVIYDVPGDIVCGGFATPIKEHLIDESYIVSSGEYLPLYAANNICRGLKTLNAPLGGVICNARGVEREREILERFARRIGTKLVAFIPKDEIVQRMERASLTVVEGAPESHMAKIYGELAERILSNEDAKVPHPLSDSELRSIFNEREGRGKR